MLNEKDFHQNGSVPNGVPYIKRGSSDKFVKRSTTPPVSSSDAIHRPSLVEMYTSRRWSVTFLSFLVITLSQTLRSSMSLAIVCMVKPINTSHVINNSQSNISSESHTDNIGDAEWYVEWDTTIQGIVLSSFFYGFPVLCVFGGWAAGKYSGKKVLVIMMTTMSIVSLGIPYAAITSPYIVIALRVIVGLSAGGITPCIMQLLSKWAPLYERSQIIAMATSGQIFGSVVTFLFSGIFCTIPYQNGWPFIFYIFGVVNLLSIVAWVKIVYDHPEDHPRMTTKEINYIIRGRRDSANVKMPNPPWLKILTSAPFWAILSAHISFGFIFNTLVTFLPLYMNDIMKFDTVLNGAVSAVPFIGRLLGTLVSGYVADFCYSRGLLSTRSIRIVFQSIGMFGSTPFLIWMSFLDNTQKELAISLLIIYWFIQGASSSGFRANHLDIAPRFAGVINGMTMTCASISATASATMASAILVNRTKEEWQIVFFICAGVGIMGTVIYDCFAQGEEQSWAQDQELDIQYDAEENSVHSTESHDNTSQLCDENSKESQHGKPKVSNGSLEINGIDNYTYEQEDRFSKEQSIFTIAQNSDSINKHIEVHANVIRNRQNKESDKSKTSEDYTVNGQMKERYKSKDTGGPIGNAAMEENFDIKDSLHPTIEERYNTVNEGSEDSTANEPMGESYNNNDLEDSKSIGKVEENNNNEVIIESVNKIMNKRIFLKLFIPNIEYVFENTRL